MLIFSAFTLYSQKHIGDLNMISTRNLDSKFNYKILSQYTKGEGKTIEQAVSAAVKKIPGGEYMRNIQVYIKGSTYIVEGDVWGIGNYKDVRLHLKPGMKVRASPKYSNSVIGKVISSDHTYVYIEFIDSKGAVKNTKAEWDKVFFAE